MKIAIMQPYFFPYIGYFQLIRAVDWFIIYDNIKYTKKGWINRNRLLRNGEEFVITIPLRKGSDSLDVRERSLADDFDRRKLLNQVREAYSRAPRFRWVFPIVEMCVMAPAQNLFEYVEGAVVEVCRYLGIGTRIIPSSSVAIDPALRAGNRVLALCKAAGADVYVNAIGGQNLYSREEFKEQGVELKFLKSRAIAYPQLDHEFVPSLSIVDVMMFNDVAAIQEFLDSGYELI